MLGPKHLAHATASKLVEDLILPQRQLPAARQQLVGLESRKLLSRYQAFCHGRIPAGRIALSRRPESPTNLLLADVDLFGVQKPAG